MKNSFVLACAVALLAAGVTIYGLGKDAGRNDPKTSTPMYPVLAVESLPDQQRVAHSAAKSRARTALPTDHTGEEASEEADAPKPAINADQMKSGKKIPVAEGST